LWNELCRCAVVSFEGMAEIERLSLWFGLCCV
jgi:hypothetical protein